MEIDVETLKRDWAGSTFDTVEFEIKTEDVLDFALSCGEVAGHYTDPGHPEFRAVPTFTSRYVGRRVLPENFPRFSNGFGFDAGKCVQALAPLRPGDKITAKSCIHDIYTKTGRSGTMLFIVHRMEFTNQRGEHVSTVDWRMVQRAGS
jgi:MaoC dehydratase-like protein